MTANVRMLVVLLCVFCGWPAYAQKITTEPDRAVDFRTIKTFTLREGVLRSPNAALNSEPLKKRIDADMTRALTGKGLTSVANSADVNVSYTFGSLAGRRAGRGSGIEGNLIVDFRAPSGTVVWHGVATVDEINASDVASKIDDMVKKLVARYPK